MITSEVRGSSTTSAPPVAAARSIAAADHGFTFHDFLSAMNPLQYLPVVGTIYRAVTGDVIPEAVRDVGSMIVSGLMGGPVGLAIYIASTVAEKVTGIDPEKIVAAQLHAAPPVGAAQAEIQSATSVSAAQPASTASARVALTAAQLAAYGVRSDASGNLKLGDVGGADVLNTMELSRLERAAAAYAANQTVPPAISGSS